MTNKMFYDKGTKSVNNSYIVDNSFLLYFVSKNLLKYGPSSKETIVGWIRDKTSISNINSYKLKEFLNHFTEKNNLFTLKSNYEKVLKKMTRFDTDFLILLQEPQEKIYKDLCTHIGCLDFNVEKVLPYSLSLFKINDRKPQEFYSSIYFNDLINYDEFYLKLDKCIALIDDGYKKLTIDFIFVDKTVADILFANGITTIQELSDLSIDSLLVIFAKDVDYYVSILSTLHDGFLINYKKIITDKLNDLEEKEKNVIYLRNGFNRKRKMVLEEIGKLYGITRERVRQIETKAMKKICSNLHLINIIFASVYLNLIHQGEKYITKERLKKFVNDDNVADFMLLLMSESYSCITYDLDLEIIYNRKVASLDDIVSEILDIYGDTVLAVEFNTLDEFEKKVIHNKYRLVNNAIYLRKGVFERELITNIIDDLFIDGFHISDDTAFEKIQAEYIKRYNYWIEGLTLRLISTYIERKNYCQIDKGTYKNRKYVPAINQYLMERIINYIIENQPIVFYETIFKRFNSELKEIGINNYYFLKGIIDFELPPEFTTKRNYIQVGSTKKTSSETIISFFKSFNREFTFEEVKNKFEGVKDYVINNYLYSEIDNGLIWISSKKFIYIDKTNISENTIKKLEYYITNLFESLNTKVLSSRKVFSKMVLTNKSLLDDLKFINDQYTMFSLLRYLFRNKYYFNRPLIAIDEESLVGQETVVREYVSKLDKFNLKIIKAYQTKLSLRGLYSYLEFMENLSDEFTQINIDTMVKKDLLGVDNQFLKKLSEMFSLIFSKFESVDTRVFNGYILLPSLDYKWNKYLLAGIIRTFFNEVYEVENTNNYYKVTDFIIRKIK